MAGNSKRRGAVRKEGTKKGMVVGSGGQRRRALEGKGPTPPAERRPGHAKAAAAARNAKRAARGPPQGRARAAPATARPPRPCSAATPWSSACGRGVPALSLTVTVGSTSDERVAEAVHLAAETGVPILEVPRGDLDRIAGGALHQGVALTVPPYEYAHPDELLEIAAESPDAGPDRRARRRHRPAQPRRGRPLGRARSAGTAWWCRSGVPRG